MSTHTHTRTHCSGLPPPHPYWRRTGIDRTLRWWMLPLPRKVRDGAISYWAPHPGWVIEVANKYTVIVIAWQLGHELLWRLNHKWCILVDYVWKRHEIEFLYLSVCVYLFTQVAIKKVIRVFYIKYYFRSHSIHQKFSGGNWTFQGQVRECVYFHYLLCPI